MYRIIPWAWADHKYKDSLLFPLHFPKRNAKIKREKKRFLWRRRSCNGWSTHRWSDLRVQGSFQPIRQRWRRFDPSFPSLSMYMYYIYIFRSSCNCAVFSLYILVWIYMSLWIYLMLFFFCLMCAEKLFWRFWSLIIFAVLFPR